MSKERIRNSFGQCHINEGTKLNIINEKYVLDNSRKFYLFDVVPMGGVRMSQSDRWKTNPNHVDPKKRQRKVVTQYFAFKNVLTLQANQMGYELGKYIDALFLIPMPTTWSNKKKEKMNGMPCESKPDTDNLLKAVCDSLRKSDQDIWYMKGIKVWAYKGSIILFA
jgi:Holliday junction resolvase RusA-like endonuclease